MLYAGNNKAFKLALNKIKKVVLKRKNNKNSPIRLGYSNLFAHSK